jgi:hypothetical protein
VTTSPESRTHTLKVADHTGDTPTLWKTGDDISTAEANRVFDEMISKGYLAYTQPDDGTDGDVIRSFDPDADTIVMMPQTIGG